MPKKLILSVTKNDCKWTYFKSTGAGGQHRDKTDNGVECLHAASGANGRASDSRSQWTNKRTAFRRMTETKEFKRWLFVQTSKKAFSESEIEKIVNKKMQPKNLKIEYGDGINWQTM